MDKPKVLYHEILAALRRYALVSNAIGNEHDGYLPLYKVDISSARLPFGTLVHLVNNSTAEVGKKPFEVEVMKREQVVITEYDFKTVAKACEVLEINEHIEDTGGKDERHFTLTKQGLKALNTEFYIKQYVKDDLERRQMRSVLETNIVSQRVGYGSLAIGFISTIFIVVTTFQQCSDKTEQELQHISTSVQMTKKALDSVVLYLRKTDSSIRQIADSLAK